MNLPAILTRYFAAANRFDADEAAECFTVDALVHDEAHDHSGREAIRAWVAETSQKYQSQVQVTAADSLGGTTQVTATVSGGFPGSPIELHFGFTIVDGKISQLHIQ